MPKPEEKSKESPDKKTQPESTEQKGAKEGGGQGRTQPQKDKDMSESRHAKPVSGPKRPEEEDINDINDQEEKSDRSYEDPQRDQDQSTRRFEQTQSSPDRGTNVH
jgi:hypothetical protein